MKPEELQVDLTATAVKLVSLGDPKTLARRLAGEVDPDKKISRLFLVQDELRKINAASEALLLQISDTSFSHKAKEAERAFLLASIASLNGEKKQKAIAALDLLRTINAMLTSDEYGFDFDLKLAKLKQNYLNTIKGLRPADVQLVHRTLQG